MQHLRRNRSRDADIWPGFVDALSALLMVVIFVLMVFTIGQFALSVELSGRDEEVVLLRNQVSDLNAELEVEQRESDTLRTQFSELTSEMQGLLMQRERLQAELSSIRSQNEGLAETIDLQTEEIARLVEENVTLDEDLATVLAVAEADRATLREQMADIAHLEDDIAALTTVRNALELEVAALELAAQEAALQIDSLTDDLDSTQSQLADTEARRVQERDEATSEIARLSQDLDLREERIAELLQQLANRLATLEASEASNQELAASLASEEASLTDLRNQLTAANNALDDEASPDSAALQVTQRDIMRLLEAVGASRDEARDLEARLADQTALTTLAQQELAATRVTAEQAQAQLSALQIEIETLRTSLGAAEANRDDLGALNLSQRAEIERLNDQVEGLRQQLLAVQQALAESEETIAGQDVEIANLNSRINLALLRRAEELSRAQSDFFGAMREILGDRDDVQIVGDRFIFSSEVLFAPGAATLQTEGQAQLSSFADTLIEIANNFPDDVDWILRVDGHTDRTPISNANFPSNWELSTARATSVVRFLISQGIPSDRLAAAGFGEHQPIDSGSTPEALARNRRIELKLDQRVANDGN